jgi:tetratricopeptide (TPR) repeat protein
VRSASHDCNNVLTCGFLAGQQATLAGLEAQIGVLQNMLRQFQPALQSFEKAVAKMKSGTLRNSPLLGLVINQMGVTCIELGDVAQAACHFEEAKSIMESTAGPHHLDTLDVCNNLACTYANLGRYDNSFLSVRVHGFGSYLGAWFFGFGDDIELFVQN